MGIFYCIVWLLTFLPTSRSAFRLSEGVDFTRRPPGSARGEANSSAKFGLLLDYIHAVLTPMLMMFATCFTAIKRSL
jgi:hypothetical protein